MPPVMSKFAFTAREMAAKLLRDGYLIVDGVYGELDGVYPVLRGMLEQAMMRAPEYKDPPAFKDVRRDGPKYGCGGTSFIGGPTVFHCAEAREWHHRTARMLMEMVQELVLLTGIPGLKLARILFDRIQIRPPGESASAESFHRDHPGLPEKDGVVSFSFGGFQNLDKQDQKFCGIKGSHSYRQGAASGIGFKKIDKAGQKHFAEMLKAQAHQEDTDAKGKIIVPPGKLIVFFADLVHAVNPDKIDDTSVKIFYGFGLTTADHTRMVSRGQLLSFEKVKKLMVENDVIPLGSGQTPAMYPAMYLVVLKQLPIFERFQEEMLIPGAMRYPLRDASGKLVHKAAHDYTRATKSLAEMGVPLHPAYRQDEFDCMLPQSDVRIFNFETGAVDTFPLYKEIKRTAEVDEAESRKRICL